MHQRLLAPIFDSLYLHYQRKAHFLRPDKIARTIGDFGQNDRPDEESKRGKEVCCLRLFKQNRQRAIYAPVPRRQTRYLQAMD